MKVLLIEDYLGHAIHMKNYLYKNGIICDFATTASEGIDKIRQTLGNQDAFYNLVMLDLGLSDMDGLVALEKIRDTLAILQERRGRDKGVQETPTPILIVTAFTDLKYKLRCFALGAQDYITKPFQFPELVCRIHVLVRKQYGYPQSAIQTGELVLDMASQEVYANKIKMDFTNKQYSIIESLFLKKGTTVSKMNMLSNMYERNCEYPSAKIVDVFICKIRSKLEEAGVKGNYIITEWGRGYKMIDLAPVKAVGIDFIRNKEKLKLDDVSKVNEAYKNNQVRLIHDDETYKTNENWPEEFYQENEENLNLLKAIANGGTKISYENSENTKDAVGENEDNLNEFINMHTSLDNDDNNNENKNFDDEPVEISVED